MSDPILAWHFLPEDGKLRYNDNRKPQIGKAYCAKGELKLCKNGMHASESIMDAIDYAPGPILCRVEMVAPIIHGDGKMVARGRKIIWKIDATEILHRFAVACAQRALRKAGVTDKRCWDACAIKLRWLDGKAMDHELDTAWDAAWAARDAAWDAAWAARAAAWDAARAAAWDAARAAARAAAWDAARAAARDAAWAAARAAAWDAARAAARAAWDAARAAAEQKWQEKKLLQLINKAKP